MDYRVAFVDTDWESALNGTARLKRIVRGDKVFRLVELTPGSEHPDWCEVGHMGMIMEGALEIEFDDRTERFAAGDALCIPVGAADRHRPRALSERAVMFLIEDEAA